MAYEFDISNALISAIITILITAVFIYFAARIVTDRSSYLAAIGVAVIGTFLALFVASLVSGIWGLVLGIAVWALVAAIFFRTGWLKGAVIGVVAWLLYFLVNLLIDWIFG